MRQPATKKRPRRVGAATAVAIAVKTEEEGDGLVGSSSHTSTATRKRARPTGCTPSAPLALKAEPAPKRAITPAESVSSESESEPQVVGEIGVAVLTWATWNAGQRRVYTMGRRNGGRREKHVQEWRVD